MVQKILVYKNFDLLKYNKSHPANVILLGDAEFGWLSRKERQNSRSGFVLARH